MNFRAFISLLRDELRCTTNDLATAYATRAGIPNSLGAATLNPAAEGTGAHPGEVGHGASPRVAVPPRDVPRPNPMVQVRHLLELIAGEKCEKVTSGSRCWDDLGATPDCPWSADRWCDACTAQVALDALTSTDCLYSREGMACRLLPDLGRELWCVNCLAYVAANPPNSPASVPTPEAGAASPTATHGDAAAAGGASNVP